MQRCDVRVADERLRVVRDHLVVEQRHDLRGAVAATQRLHHVDVRIGEERVQVARPRSGVTGDVIVARVDAAAELDAIAALLPPADSAVDLGAVLVRRRRRGNADRPALREWMREH